MTLTLVGVALNLAAVVVLLWAADGRWLVAGLGLLRLGVFALLLTVWPPTLAAVPLAAGWLSALLLGVAQRGRPAQRQRLGWGERMLRLAALALGWLTALSLAPRASEWIPGVTAAGALAGLGVLAAGLLLLGLEQDGLTVVVGLLMIWSGFLPFYAAVEQALLVVGWMAVLEIGLALVGGYLLAWEGAA